VNNKCRQRGIALVLTLWMSALLTVIAGSFAFTARTNTLLAQNLAASARAEALADAGIYRAIYELLKPATSANVKGNGVPSHWDFGGAQLRVTLLDVAGKIDLNYGSEVLLRGLLKNAGLNENQREALLDAIVDWRDRDDLRRANGAEAAEYRAAGLAYVPSNAPFSTVDELQRVLGMTPVLYAKLADALTVESAPVGVTVDLQQGGINPAVASKQVLLALPHADAAQVDDFLAKRSKAWAENNPAIETFAPATGFSTSTSNLAYTIKSEARLPDGTRFVRETIVKINPNSARKVAFLAWKEGEAAE
jgi:general secretion pathway protein K